MKPTEGTTASESGRHPPMPETESVMAAINADRDRLVEAALPHVPFDGWSRVTLEAAAADAGMSEVEVDAVLPQGVKTLVEHHLATIDAEMEARLDEMDLPGMRVRDRIATAIRLRLGELAPDREVVRRTVAFLARPGHGALACRTLYRTVDSIWYCAGDRSTDYNFYTKRALLAAVYSSTLLYWLEDRSENSEESWAFMERRLADVMKIPQLPRQLGDFAKRMPNPLRFAERFRTRTG